MKLAYGNYGMPHTPYETMIEQVARLGYDGLELCVTNGYPSAPDQLDTARRKHLTQLIEDSGLEVGSCLVSGLHVLAPDTQTHQANLAALQAIFALCADLHLERPVVSSTMGGRIDDWPSLGPKLADYTGEWVEVAAEHGGIFACEPHVGGLIHTPEQALWLLQAVNHPALALNFDYSHFELIDVSLAEAMTQLLPYAVGVHVKDVRGRYPDFKFLLPGEGTLDYADYLKQLAANGYNGQVTIEVSGQIFNASDYDALTAAQFAYQSLATAFDSAGLSRQ